ncbi:MAG: helix-turn-helix transcriptional regulator [Allorhizobium sp.]
MESKPIATRARSENEQFWENMRLNADVPCLVSGVFCADRKVLQDVNISVQSNDSFDAAGELVKHLIERMSVFATIRFGIPNNNGNLNEDSRAADFPIWFRLNSTKVGVGRPVASLYPVVAFRQQHDTPRANVRELLEPGLARVEKELMNRIYGPPAWPEGLAEATLRLLSIGFFVIDASGVIVHDHSGEEQAKDKLWHSSRSRLCVKSEDEQKALKVAISAATSGSKRGSIISVSSESGGTQMAAVAPLQLGEQVMALVLFERRQTDHRALREHFFRVHSLTRSEGVVAREVLDGRAPAEIAERTGMSVGTVRSYLKQVFAKTGTHRQSELVSHYYSSILPIGASIARADLQVEHGKPQSRKLTLVTNTNRNIHH